MSPRTLTCLATHLLALLTMAIACRSDAQVFDLERDNVPLAKLDGLWRFHLGDDPDKLMANWQSRLTPEEKEALAKVRDRKVAPTRDITARESVDFAVGHLFQREDVVTERKLRKTAVHYGISYVTPDDVDKEIKGALERGEILKKDGKKARNMSGPRR